MYQHATENSFQVDAGQQSGEPIWYVNDAAYDRAMRRAMRERSALAVGLARKAIRFLRGQR